MAVAAPAVRRIPLSDFSGGLNLRDSPNEIALNETPSSLNWTLDQRGGLRWRSGCTNVATLPGVSGKVAFIFYSEALDQWLCVRETAGAPNTMSLHTRPGNLSGVWTNRGSLGTTVGVLVGFVDFPGTTPRVVITSAAGSGTLTWDGTTLAAVTSTLAGSALAVWHDRVWRIGYPINDGSGFISTLFASKIGDPTIWAPPDGLRVDLRIKDAGRLWAIGLAGASLLVFKKRSAYRIVDPITGEPSMIDGTAGAIGPLAFVSSRGRLYSWGADSLYEWDGIGPGRKVGDKARPLFAVDPALVSDVPGLCGGAFQDRVLFAYPSTAGGVNDSLLEYDPAQGWLVRHQLASSSSRAVSSFARKGADLYAAVADGDALYQIFAGGSGKDDGTVQAPASWRTPWLQPNAGRMARILRAQIEGLLSYGGGTEGASTLALRVYRDWDLSTYTEFLLTGSGLKRNIAPPAAGAPSAPVYTIDQMVSVVVNSLGHAQSFSFELVATRANDAPAPVGFIASLALDTIALER